MSLWWDQQLEAFSDPDKRYHIILQTLLPHLQKLLQLALKSTTLPHAEKQELLQLRKGLQLR
ncbi:MAG: hypothetical protein Q4B28_01985 [bacterium]|nr:hypothetical protein [bacterium]